MLKWFCLLICLGIVTACADSEESDVTDLTATNQAWSDSADKFSKSKDPTEILSFFENKDIVELFIPGAGMMKSVDEIRQFLMAAVDDFAGYNWTTDRAWVNGDYGSTRGTNYHNGVVSGFYMTTWRRQADGSWKVVSCVNAPAE
jgi:hypothetical protein